MDKRYGCSTPGSVHRQPGTALHRTQPGADCNTIASRLRICFARAGPDAQVAPAQDYLSSRSARRRRSSRRPASVPGAGASGRAGLWLSIAGVRAGGLSGSGSDRAAPSSGGTGSGAGGPGATFSLRPAVARVLAAKSRPTCSLRCASATGSPRHRVSTAHSRSQSRRVTTSRRRAMSTGSRNTASRVNQGQIGRVARSAASVWAKA